MKLTYVNSSLTDKIATKRKHSIFNQIKSCLLNIRGDGDQLIPFWSNQLLVKNKNLKSCQEVNRRYRVTCRLLTFL